MVFQGPSLLPALDVLENVAFPLLLADISDRAPADGHRRAATGSGSPRWPANCPRNSPVARPSGWPSPACWPPAPELILADEPTGQLDHQAAAGSSTCCCRPPTNSAQPWWSPPTTR